MKANRKFLNGDDEAVSPVIAVILMVAITVVLAATVYVWVSGFGSNSGQAAKTVSLSSGGSIDSTTYSGDFAKSYIVTAATPGMRYADFSLTMEGVAQSFESTACNPTGNANWSACAGTTARASTDVVAAGDRIILRTDTSPAGLTLRALDSEANSVMLTLVVG